MVELEEVWESDKCKTEELIPGKVVVYSHRILSSCLQHKLQNIKCLKRIKCFNQRFTPMKANPWQGLLCPQPALGPRVQDVQGFDGELCQGEGVKKKKWMENSAKVEELGSSGEDYQYRKRLVCPQQVYLCSCIFVFVYLCICVFVFVYLCRCIFVFVYLCICLSTAGGKRYKS